MNRTSSNVIRMLIESPPVDEPSIPVLMPAMIASNSAMSELSSAKCGNIELAEFKQLVDLV